MAKRPAVDVDELLAGLGHATCPYCAAGGFGTDCERRCHIDACARIAVGLDRAAEAEIVSRWSRRAS